MTRPIIIALLAFSLVFGGAELGLSQDGATKTYVVQKGDTLSKIAKKFYGKANLGSKLWRANQNMVANPRRLTPGDVLYIFPESSLALNQPLSVPPAPETPSVNLYPKPDYLKMSFPKYFSFLTDLKNRSNTSRIRIKKLVPRVVTAQDPNDEEKTIDITVNDLKDELFEVRVVGEILASQDRGPTIRDDGFSAVKMGRSLLSTGDNVIIRFNEDLMKIMDSDTHNDSDPYFTSFPIYAIEEVIQEPDRQSPSFGRSLGHLMSFRGKITVVSRVEGLAPPPPMDVRKMKTRDLPNRDLESVSYVARVTYAEDAIHIGDKVVLFLPVNPGPERRLDSPYVEPRDSYRAPGQ
ncbi:MAG: LysM peptidoglycan-binding domain-containing protein [Deltaproteobacteria bacterium]|nr:LysM peptidoglycan-binding domain-containing protein [Deltaproteobacteria bacterium]